MGGIRGASALLGRSEPLSVSRALIFEVRRSMIYSRNAQRAGMMATLLITHPCPDCLTKTNK